MLQLYLRGYHGTRRGWLSGKGAPHVAYGSWVRDSVVRVDTTIGDKGNGLSTEFLDPMGTVRLVPAHAQK